MPCIGKLMNYNILQTSSSVSVSIEFSINDVDAGNNNKYDWLGFEENKNVVKKKDVDLSLVESCVIV